jgi:hypothetical protein
MTTAAQPRVCECVRAYGPEQPATAHHAMDARHAADLSGAVRRTQRHHSSSRFPRPISVRSWLRTPSAQTGRSVQSGSQWCCPASVLTWSSFALFAAALGVYVLYLLVMAAFLAICGVAREEIANWALRQADRQRLIDLIRAARGVPPSPSDP